MINLKANEIARHFYGKLDAKIAHELFKGLKAVGVDVTLSIMEKSAGDFENFTTQFNYLLKIKNKTGNCKWEGVI